MQPGSKKETAIGTLATATDLTWVREGHDRFSASAPAVDAVLIAGELKKLSIGSGAASKSNFQTRDLSHESLPVDLGPATEGPGNLRVSIASSVALNEKFIESLEAGTLSAKVEAARRNAPASVTLEEARARLKGEDIIRERRSGF